MQTSHDCVQSINWILSSPPPYHHQYTSTTVTIYTKVPFLGVFNPPKRKWRKQPFFGAENIFRPIVEIKWLIDSRFQDCFNRAQPCPRLLQLSKSTISTMSTLPTIMSTLPTTMSILPTTMSILPTTMSTLRTMSALLTMHIVSFEIFWDISIVKVL